MLLQEDISCKLCIIVGGGSRISRKGVHMYKGGWVGGGGGGGGAKPHLDLPLHCSFSPLTVGDTDIAALTR